MPHPTNHPTPLDHVNTALDDITHQRAQLIAQPLTPERAGALADLADQEAAWWETAVEHCEIRVYWRAALIARDHARSAARWWRHHAEQVSAPAAEMSAVGEVAA